MNNNSTMSDGEITDKKPRKSRQPKTGRRVFVSRITDGKPKEQGSFPEATIGDPLERRLPTFLQELFGAGEYKVEIRKPNGHFERSYDFSISDTEREHQDNVIDIEPDEFDAEPEQFPLPRNNSDMNAVEVENLLLKERLKRLEEDFSRQKSGNQSEMQTLISALEESRREQKELMMLMLAQAQKPQQDATTQAMNILEKSLGIVTKAKAISEEIAPNESSSSGGSLLSDGAKLIDSIGRNAGTFLPLLMSNLPKPTPQPQTNRPPVSVTAAPAVDGTDGEFSNLAKKIQKPAKEEVEK